MQLSDDLVVLQLKEVLDIQGMLDSFLEVLQNGVEVPLKTFVKQLTGIPSVFAIVAIMKVSFISFSMSFEKVFAPD